MKCARTDSFAALAAALALPPAFPYRNLIVLTAFCVVLGTLVIQGLTLKPLLRFGRSQSMIAGRHAFAPFQIAAR